MVRQELRIIVEGPDGSGKSTLIDHLTERFHNLERVRNERFDKQDFNLWWPEQLERTASPLVPIHDRFFYSELVYGPVLRGRINAEPSIVQNVAWFIRMSAMLIYARPPTEALKKGVTTHQQMEGVVDNLDLITDGYDKLMSSEITWYGPRFVHYNFTSPVELKRVEKLVDGYLSGGQVD